MNKKNSKKEVKSEVKVDLKKMNESAMHLIDMARSLKDENVAKNDARISIIEGIAALYGGLVIEQKVTIEDALNFSNLLNS